MTERRWLDAHIHVSDRGDDDAVRPQFTDDLLKVLDDADADLRLVVSGDMNLYDPVRSDPDGAHDVNAFIHRLVAKAPDRLYGACLVNPNFLDASLRTMEMCFEQWGFVMLGEMLPYMFDFTMDSDASERVVRAAVDYDVPVQVHVSTFHTRSHPSGYGREQMIDLFGIVERVPEARYILAHAVGGMKDEGVVVDDYVDMVEERFGAWPRNFWIEIAQFQTPALASALARIPDDRLITGTDWTTRVGPPFMPYGALFGIAGADENPFPPCVGELARFLAEAGATDEEVDRIGFRNAAELLKIA